MTDDLKQVAQEACGILAVATADDRNMPQAAQMVTELADRHGPKATLTALVVWIDMLGHGLGHTLGQPFTFRLENAQTGEFTGPDEAPPEVAMCARLISARFNDDKATFEALLKSLPSDEEYTAVIAQVLSTCSIMLRRMITDGTVQGLS